MTLVVADSGPIRYLVVIGAIETLPRLYSRIVLPKVVVQELTHPSAPAAVRTWASMLPNWAEILLGTEKSTPELDSVLDAGEAAAITLANEIHADFVLLDEREGRRMAVKSGLRIAGTIGILETAAEKGLINLQEYLTKLQATNFRIEPQFLKEALARDASRRRVG
jgi:predicted nucleic acid-binding protein